MIGCSGFTLALSVFLLRRANAMRKRPIEAGSTMHLEDAGFGGHGVTTLRSETKKPSFLNDRETADD